MTDGNAVRRDQGEAVLWCEADRLEVRSPQRLSPAQEVAPKLGVAAADEDLRDRRHVHQVRCAHRADRRHDRVDPRIEQCDEPIGDRLRRA